MNVEVVQQADLPTIAGWHYSRGIGAWPEGWLSPYGYWVPGLAAGWFVPTESSRALLEDFVTNPEADRAATNEALFAVEARICEEARARGFRYLIGATKLDVIRSRVRRAGYEVSEATFSLHCKELFK